MLLLCDLSSEFSGPFLVLLSITFELVEPRPRYDEWLIASQIQHGDTLQLLTWAPEAIQAYEAAVTAAAAIPPPNVQQHEYERAQLFHQLSVFPLQM